MSMLRTMYMRMKQALALNAAANLQAGAFVIVTSATILGRNGDFRFMMLLGV